MIISVHLTVLIKLQKLESGRDEPSDSKRLPLAAFQPHLSAEKHVYGFEAMCSPRAQDQNSQPERPEAYFRGLGAPLLQTYSPKHKCPHQCKHFWHKHRALEATVVMRDPEQRWRRTG